MSRFVEYGLPDAAGHVITVTATATLIESLIDTASSGTSSLPDSLDAVQLTPEDGDIRWLADGNTPTATNGAIIYTGSTVTLEGVIVKKLRLIRDGASNVKVTVRVGRTMNS